MTYSAGYEEQGENTARSAAKALPGRGRYTVYMVQIILSLALLSIPMTSANKAPVSVDLDSNAAFYKGEALNYVIYPPYNYRMATDEANVDGYSFAFVPKDAAYYDAETIIGINIYKIRGMKFSEALTRDTSALRDYYGPDVVLRRVDSVFSSNGREVAVFYVNDEKSFVPTAMMSYFDGGTELLIFELVVSLGSPRYQAENLYLECLRHMKAMPVGELGQR
jgi:hypothetical protein